MIPPSEATKEVRSMKQDLLEARALKNDIQVEA